MGFRVSRFANGLIHVSHDGMLRKGGPLQTFKLRNLIGTLKPNCLLSYENYNESKIFKIIIKFETIKKLIIMIIFFCT